MCYRTFSGNHPPGPSSQDLKRIWFIYVFMLLFPMGNNNLFIRVLSRGPYLKPAPVPGPDRKVVHSERSDLRRGLPRDLKRNTSFSACPRYSSVIRLLFSETLLAIFSPFVQLCRSFGSFAWDCVPLCICSGLRPITGLNPISYIKTQTFGQRKNRL